MKTNKRAAILLSLVIFILSSCSTSKLLPDSTSNNAKNLPGIEDKAIVYIYRTSAFGAAVGLSVDINDTRLATFYAKRFYLCVLDPGEYVFTGHGENKHEITLVLEKGEKYYLKVIPRMGLLIARCELQLVTQNVGIRDLQSCRLIGMNDDAQLVLR